MKSAVLRCDLKEDTESSSLISSGRLTHLCMYHSQDTLQKAGRKETRTGGRVSQFIQFSGHHFSSWSAGAASPPQRGQSCARRPKLHQEAHLHTFSASRHIHTSSLCLSVTHTPGWLSKNSDIPSVLWKLVWL